MLRLYKFIIFVLLILLLLIAIRADASVVGQYCDIYAHYDRVGLMKYTDSHWDNFTYLEDQTAIADILNWNVDENFWVDTSGYGYFDYPDDVYRAYTIKLTNGENHHNLEVILSPSDAYAYLMFFDNIEAFADSSGNHYGIHPCRVWKMPAASFIVFYEGLIND